MKSARAEAGEIRKISFVGADIIRPYGVCALKIDFLAGEIAGGQPSAVLIDKKTDNLKKSDLAIQLHNKKEPAPQAFSPQGFEHYPQSFPHRYVNGPAAK